MRVLHLKSPIGRWWRRQMFRLRQISSIKLTLAFICLLSLIIILPNPFSCYYSPLPLNQDAEWDNIEELWTMKEQVCRFIFVHVYKRRSCFI